MSLSDKLTQDLNITQSCYHYNQGIPNKSGRWRNRSERPFSAQSDGDRYGPKRTLNTGLFRCGAARENVL